MAIEDEPRSAFEKGFFGVADEQLDRSGEYRLGDVAARALLSAQVSEPAEPSELEIRRRLAAIADAKVTPPTQSVAEPRSGSSRPWLAAAATIAVIGIATLLLRPQADPAECGQFAQMPVVACSAGADALLETLSERLGSAELMARTGARPPLPVVLEAAETVLASADVNYLFVDARSANEPGPRQLALVFETHSEPTYLALQEQFLESSRTAPIGAEMRRAHTQDSLRWDQGSLLSVISVINLF